jgi:hypothetical protein
MHLAQTGYQQVKRIVVIREEITSVSVADPEISKRAEGAPERGPTPENNKNIRCWGSEILSFTNIRW